MKKGASWTYDTPSFYRFIEDNFRSFIPWFVRDIR